ncbi:MAG: hypothetical protein WCE25_01365, partial [Nitrososphaeraceae archaeon]
LGQCPTQMSWSFIDFRTLVIFFTTLYSYYLLYNIHVVSIFLMLDYLVDQDLYHFWYMGNISQTNRLNIEKKKNKQYSY